MNLLNKTYKTFNNRQEMFNKFEKFIRRDNVRQSKQLLRVIASICELEYRGVYQHSISEIAEMSQLSKYKVRVQLEKLMELGMIYVIAREYRKNAYMYHFVVTGEFQAVLYRFWKGLVEDLRGHSIAIDKPIKHWTHEANARAYSFRSLSYTLSFLRYMGDCVLNDNGLNHEYQKTLTEYKSRIGF